MNLLTDVMTGTMYKVWAISLLCYIISCGCIYITEANTWLYCCDCALVSCLYDVVYLLLFFDSTGKSGDSVILDIGCLWNGYCSDMTRTVFIGEVSDRAREVYNVVLEANLRGIAAAKPGNRMCDVDLAARNYIEEKGFGEYFTHRTGHSIGLEDHEFGDVSSVNTDIIKVGQCFSVEPGIYLPDENIGVRIEDLVLITEDGCEVLNDYTKELIVVPEE